MSISRLYNKTVSTKRLGNVTNSRKETWATYLTDVSCTIQSASTEHSELHDAAFYKLFKMWCASDTDILTGDKVTDGSTTYHVRAVSVKNYGNEATNHLVVMLALGE